MSNMPKTIMEIDCVRCKESQSITVGTEDLANWRDGALIQDTMPYLSADDREVLISGTCGSCFDKMFGDEEENEDE
jgi:hypothetical protein